MKNVSPFHLARRPLCLLLLSISAAHAADTAPTPAKTAVLVPNAQVRIAPAPVVVKAAPAPVAVKAAPGSNATFVNAATVSAVCTPSVPVLGCTAPVAPQARVRRVVSRKRATLVSAAPLQASYAPTESITMALGDIKMVPVYGKVTRVALGSGSVLSATAVDKSMLLIAETVGETSLMVWSGGSVQSYRVTVVSKDLRALRARVDALVGGQKGIVVTQVGPDLILSGLAHKELLLRLNPMLSTLPNVINNITEDQGTAFTRSVLFRLTFVEVKRSLLEQIGINWAKDAQGPTFAASGIAKNTGIYDNVSPGQSGGNLLSNNPSFLMRNGTTGGIFFGLATTITSRLNLGVTDGDARVLASPELTAKSGGKAKLQVGGEVPIPLTGAFGATTVEFKPYGIMFAVEPQIDSDNTITAKLSTELSQIDPSVSVNGIPGFITRNTSTEISIKPGEIVALSGLINSELSSAIDRVPGLSRVPIFGRLFRSDDFRNRKTELIVFVEAEIITAGDGLAGQLRARGVEAKREFESKLQQSAQPPFPAPAPAPFPSRPRAPAAKGE